MNKPNIKYMNLKIFDFDSTLVKQPEEYNWEHDQEDKDFMDSTESLKVNFKINEKVLEKYKEKDRNTKYILLTNRSEKIKKEVLDILKKWNIDFDFHLFRKNDRSKGNRLINLLKKFDNNNINSIEYYEDKEKHLKDIYRVSKIFDQIDFRLNRVFENRIITC